MPFVPPALLVVFGFVLGAIVGSFLNAACYRLPRGISLWEESRSFCPHCRRPIAWYDNLPLASYLLLRGRCRQCGRRIGVHYFLLELFCAATFALLAYHVLVLNYAAFSPACGAYTVAVGGGRHVALGPVMVGLLYAVMLGSFICLAVTDVRHGIIPRQTTDVQLGLFLLAAPLLPQLHYWGDAWTSVARVDALLDGLQGVILGGGTLWSVGAFYLLVRRIPAMGDGDVLLVAAAGALFGWKAALVIIGVGACLGLLGAGVVLGGGALWKAMGFKVKKWSPEYEVAGEAAAGGESLQGGRVLGLGLLVTVVELSLFALAFRGVLAGRLSRMLLIVPSLGAAMGLFAIFYHLVRVRGVAAGRWPEPKIVTREDGRRVEVLDEQRTYVPFGPALASAAALYVFFGPAVMGYLKSAGGLIPWRTALGGFRVPFW